MKTIREDQVREGIGPQLTKTQLEIRARCDGLPRHVQRSIDAYRKSLGLPQLWGTSLERIRRA
jgi:hypothetical protein